MKLIIRTKSDKVLYYKVTTITMFKFTLRWYGEFTEGTDKGIDIPTGSRPYKVDHKIYNISMIAVQDFLIE